jgi:hypothetical protein
MRLDSVHRGDPPLTQLPNIASHSLTGPAVTGVTLILFPYC